MKILCDVDYYKLKEIEEKFNEMLDEIRMKYDRDLTRIQAMYRDANWNNEYRWHEIKEIRNKRIEELEKVIEKQRKKITELMKDIDVLQKIKKRKGGR